MLNRSSIAATATVFIALAGAVSALCAENRPVPTGVALTNAPELNGLGPWYNSPPLSMESLRGKVVLVNFWTYGCVNCVNTLPHVTALYAKYKDKGLVVIGIHTPEFPFERSASNVQAALKRHGIVYPVAQDNKSQTWSAYGNRYWPAQYIVDQRGSVVFHHDGEGAYDQIELNIKRLLTKTG